MLRTERLYYTDSHIREFEGQVLNVEPDPKGFRVYLDRTAFYPESGGQLMDRGTLGGIAVVGVNDEGETIAHVVERRPEGEVLRGEIDWDYRFDHMQQHTGQHVLSAAFEKTGDYKTVSFHMGTEVSTIDLDSDRLGRRQFEEAENLANEIVFADRNVWIFFKSSQEAAALDLRKPSERQGEVRLVEVDKFDLSACGGTHVSRTGAIGLILIRKHERTKGCTRVEFVCGSRALRAARRDFLTLSEAARLFSTPLENVTALITKQSDEFRSASRTREKMVKRLAEYHAVELWRSASEREGRKIIRHVFPAEDQMEARLVAQRITAQGSSVALIGVKGQPAALYLAQSADGTSDMAVVLRRTLAVVGGKGGGSRAFAQGGGFEEQKIDEALRIAEGLIQE